MTTRTPTTSLARAATLGAALIVAVAVGVILLGRGGGGIAGMPSPVRQQVGASPVVLTLNGSVLSLISSPGVERLAALETAIAHQRWVRRQYGPVTWLQANIAAIARQVASHTTAKVSRADVLVRNGATGGLALADGSLSSTLVFGSGIAPVAAVRWLFPSAGAVRIFIRTSGSAGAATVARRLQGLVAVSGLTAVSATVRGS